DASGQNRIVVRQSSEPSRKRTAEQTERDDRRVGATSSCRRSRSVRAPVRRGVAPSKSRTPSSTEADVVASAVHMCLLRGNYQNSKHSRTEMSGLIAEKHVTPRFQDHAHFSGLPRSEIAQLRDVLQLGFVDPRLARYHRKRGRIEIGPDDEELVNRVRGLIHD